MKKSIISTLFISILSYNLYAQDTINIHPNLSQIIFEKDISKDNVIKLPETFIPDSFFFETNNNDNIRNFTFKAKSDFNLSSIPQGTKVIIQQKEYIFLKYDNQYIYLNDNNKLEIKNISKINNISFPDLNFNNNSYFEFHNKSLGNIKGSYLFSGLQWKELYNFNINLDSYKGKFDSFIHINNQTDLSFDNVNVRLLYNNLNIRDHIRNQHSKERAMVSTFDASEGLSLIDIPQETIIANKNVVTLNNISLKSQQSEMIHLSSNINFDFKILNTYNINFFNLLESIRNNSKVFNIKPQYSLLIERNNHNEKIFNLENNNIIIYDKDTKNIINVVNGKKENNDIINFNLGINESTQLQLEYHHTIEVNNNFTYNSSSNNRNITEKYIATMAHFVVKEPNKQHTNILHNLSVNGGIILNKKLSQDDLNKLYESIKINREVYNNNFNRIIRPYIIKPEDYFKSETYTKNKDLIIFYSSH